MDPVTTSEGFAKLASAHATVVEMLEARDKAGADLLKLTLEQSDRIQDLVQENDRQYRTLMELREEKAQREEKPEPDPGYLARRAYDLTMRYPGERIPPIRDLRRETEIGLKQAKELVEAVQEIFQAGISRGQAKAMLDDLARKAAEEKEDYAAREAQRGNENPFLRDED